jgi:prepilin-type processing-associated H-X9-DG protein
MIYDEIDFRDGGIVWQDPPPRSSWFAKWTKYFLIIMCVGIVIALLLPMPTSCNWPRARLFQCRNNLRQLGLRIAQYTNVKGQYPPGTISNPDLPLERRLGWGIPIPPYIDEAGYCEEHGTTLEAAQRLASDDPLFADLHPSVTRCPESFSETRSNFIAIAGLGPDAPALPTNHPRAGIFGDDRRVRPADIKDGTASTMMLAETDNLPGPWFAGGRATVRGLDPTNQPYIGKGRQLGGNHAGEANVLMADGSIKFISESINPKILEALSTMAGGEKLPVPWDKD